MKRHAIVVAYGYKSDMITNTSRRVRSLCLASALALAMFTAATPAFAWGDTGHRIIGTLAIEILPASAPAFLRTAKVAADVGEWAHESDRWAIRP